MKTSLYDPQYGFYVQGPQIGTPAGPFDTNAKFPAFAFGLAQAFKQILNRLGPSTRILELGGGTGQLGRSIKKYLDRPVEYLVVDPSPGLRAYQKKQGLQTVEDLTQVTPGPTVVFGNEVLDALPVHRVMGMDHGKLMEFFIDLDEDGELFEYPADVSTHEFERRFKLEQVTMGRGQIGEVCLELRPLFQKIRDLMEPGYIIFVDYGDIAANLYSYRHRNGTLRSYYHQGQIHDPFYAIGEQDLTADVDFTAVRLEADEAGFDGAGPISQRMWLKNLGIGNYTSTGVPLKSAELEIDLLTKNSKLGSTFNVLIFKTKGLPDGPGLTAPSE